MRAWKFDTSSQTPGSEDVFQTFMNALRLALSHCVNMTVGSQDMGSLAWKASTKTRDSLTITTAIAFTYIARGPHR
jgi:hypothetical protein